MYDYDDLYQDFEYLSISSEKKKRRRNRRKPKTCIQIYFDPKIMGLESVYFTQLGCREVEEIVINGVLRYKMMNNTMKKYREIQSFFAKNKLCVKSIKEVINPYLKRAFEMKRKFFYNNKEPLELFHGTKNKYIDQICTHNFNWRFSGSEKGHRHGKGVYFSVDPHFAAIFGDKKKVAEMIIADVLVGNMGEGKENLVVPPYGTDTTFGKNQKILVKFYDNEFYPKYIVTLIR